MPQSPFYRGPNPAGQAQRQQQAQAWQQYANTRTTASQVDPVWKARNEASLRELPQYQYAEAAKKAHAAEAARIAAAKSSAPDMTAYAPPKQGQAQPVQQSQGTPYDPSKGWMDTLQRNYDGWKNSGGQGAPPPSAGPQVMGWPTGSEPQHTSIPVPQTFYINPTTGQRTQVAPGGQAPTGQGWMPVSEDAFRSWSGDSGRMIRQPVDSPIDQGRQPVPDQWFMPNGIQTAAQLGDAPVNRSYSNAWNQAMEGYKNIPGMRVTPAASYGGDGQGNLAYATQRPSPFTTRLSSNFAKTPNDTQSYMSQRDAFIQRLNEERGKLSAQAGVYYPNEVPKFYQPSRDFQTMWGQAGDMVKSGWQNPLAGLFG